MPNIAPVKYPSNFMMRVDDEFVDALDEICRDERPVLSKADMVRKLVFERRDRVRKKRGAQ